MLPRLLASRSSSRPASFGSRGGFIWISWSEIAVLTSPQNTHTHDAHCAPTRPRRLRTCTLSPCLVTVPLLLLAGRSAARLPGQQPPLARTAAHPLLLLRAAPGRANGASRSGPPCSRPRPSPRWPTPTPSRPFSPTPSARAARTGRRRRRHSSFRPTSRRWRRRRAARPSARSASTRSSSCAPPSTPPSGPLREVRRAALL